LVDGATKGQNVKTVPLPIAMDGKRLGVRHNPPALGQHTWSILAELGYDAEKIDAMQSRKAVR
jgi:crotonobetainyl-CoA:carnitine CoA-transferase CaiB-like acyl-CoA transferase